MNFIILSKFSLFFRCIHKMFYKRIFAYFTNCVWDRRTYPRKNKRLTDIWMDKNKIWNSSARKMSRECKGPHEPPCSKISFAYCSKMTDTLIFADNLFWTSIYNWKAHCNLYLTSNENFSKIRLKLTMLVVWGGLSRFLRWSSGVKNERTSTIFSGFVNLSFLHLHTKFQLNWSKNTQVS